MNSFDVLKGVAAHLPISNVDTDMIIPKQFLKSPRRTGYAQALFFELRFNPEGSEIADFVLNREPYRSAQILVGGENFGCGSSREHAPWALENFGIRCIIAPSFADIFEHNCYKNSILPIRLGASEMAQIAAAANDARRCVLEVDLLSQEIRLSDGAVICFPVEPYRRECLLKGLDDIGVTLQRIGEIESFEQQHWQLFPWIGPKSRHI